jgi:hypothetical protein
VADKRDRPGTVFIAEEHDIVPGEEASYLTGTFSALWQTDDTLRDEQSGLSAEDAIAWGLERTDRVLIRLGVGDYYWAGAGQGPPETAPWPPPNLGNLTRRRHPDFAYLDRTPADDSIEWRVTAWVGPPRPADTSTRVPISDGVAPEVVAAIADRAAATWDSDARDTLLADVDQARRAAKRRGQEEGGWMSHGRDAYRLQLTVSAPTEQLACEQAASRFDELPPGLGLETLSAVPARQSPR